MSQLPATRPADVTRTANATNMLSFFGNTGRKDDANRSRRVPHDNNVSRQTDNNAIETRRIRHDNNVSRQTDNNAIETRRIRHDNNVSRQTDNNARETRRVSHDNNVSRQTDNNAIEARRVHQDTDEDATTIDLDICCLFLQEFFKDDSIGLRKLSCRESIFITPPVDHQGISSCYAQPCIQSDMVLVRCNPSALITDKALEVIEIGTTFDKVFKAIWTFLTESLNISTEHILLEHNSCESVDWRSTLRIIKMTKKHRLNHSLDHLTIRILYDFNAVTGQKEETPAQYAEICRVQTNEQSCPGYIQSTMSLRLLHAIHNKIVPFERTQEKDFLNTLSQRMSMPYAGRFNEDDQTKVDAAFRIILEHVCALVLAISEGWTSDEIEQQLGDIKARLFFVLQAKVKYDGSITEFVDEAAKCVEWLKTDFRISAQTISKVLQKFEIDFEVKQGDTLKRLREEANRITVAADAEWVLFKTIEQYKKEWEFTETAGSIKSNSRKGRGRGRKRNDTESPPPKRGRSSGKLH